MGIVTLLSVFWHTGDRLTASAEPNGSNLIYNGDFQSGNTGFTSNYTFSPGNTQAESVYDVLSNPHNANPNAASFGDHTSGTGLMMAVNGATASNRVIWSQTVAVTPNRSYNFSVWVSSWTSASPAQVTLWINGASPGPFTAPSVPGVWQQYQVIWNSNSNNVAAIQFIDENTNATGNDFALDDISLVETGLADKRLDIPLLKQGVSPYNDANPSWEGLEYDHSKSQFLWCGKTIADCGCVITSIAMILRYYGVPNPVDGSPTTPKSVNDYFNRDATCTNEGCVSRGYAYGDVRWAAAGGYSQEANSKYHTQKIIYDADGGGGYNPDLVRQDINDNRPVILWNTARSHWFVAMGISGNTFMINDPLYDRTRLDDPAYGNNAAASRRYKKTSSDFSSIEVPALAPAQVLITDPDGKRTGFDPVTNQVVQEIPNSSYFFSHAIFDELSGQSPPPDNAGVYWATVGTPQAGKYQVQIIAPTNEVYSFAVYASETNANTTVNAFEGTLVSGAPEILELLYNSDQPVQIERTADNQDASVQYDGWRGVIDASANGSAFRVSNTKNDAVTLKFKGKSVKWISLRGPNQGKAQVEIDGIDKGTFDLYSATRQYRFSKKFKKLKAGKHTLTIKVLGTKNTNSSDTNVVVDAFVVGKTTTQDDSNAVAYNKWDGKKKADASGGGYRASAKKNAKARFTFTSTRVDWITAKGPAYGKAKVLIDGIDQGDFDLYSATQQWQVAIPFTSLSDGQHMIEVRPLGIRNKKSTGSSIIIDAFRGPFTAIGASQ